MSIPIEISREKIEEAIRGWSPSDIEKLIRSTKFDLVFEGKRYPPKEAIRYAYKLLPKPRPRFRGSFNGGKQVNSFLLNLNFEIMDKQGNPMTLDGYRKRGSADDK